MFENIIFSNESYFDTTENKIALRRYRENLIFYTSFDSTLTANYSIANPVPTGTGLLENLGVFSQHVKLSSPLIYDSLNFRNLSTEGTIKFRLRTQFNNGICYQTTINSYANILNSGKYYFDVYINNTFVETRFAVFNYGFTISQILGSLVTALSGIPISIINTPTNKIQFYSQVAGDYIEIKETTSIPQETGNYSFVSFFGGMNEPIIPNAPEADVDIFSFGTTNNKISLTHTTDSELILKVTDNSGNTLIDQNFGVWSNLKDVFYAFDVGWSNSIIYLFVDGNLFGVSAINPLLVRVGGEVPLILRDGGTVADLYDYDELEVYNVIQNYKNYIPATSPITPYTITKPYADINLGSGYSFGEISDIDVLCHNNCHFVVRTSNNWYYYYSGAWRISDGSFSQSSDASSFEVNFKDLQIIPSSDIVVRVYFDSDGETECWIETLEIIVDASGEAPAIITGTVAITGTADLTSDYNITIITDQGQGTVDIGSLAVDRSIATRDEIVAAINAAGIPGLDTVIFDSDGHLIFRTLTKGSEAYLSVTNAPNADALSIIFGEEAIDNGENGQVTVLSYSPLFDFVRLQCGAPVVPVELTDEQLNSCLQEAVWYYNKFRNSKENVYYYEVAGDPTEGYEVPAIIGGDEYIVDIVMKPRLPFGYNAAAPFGVQSIYMQHWFQKFGSLSEPGFLSDYYLTLSFMKDINISMGGQPYWEIRNNRLFIYPYPDGSMTTAIKYRALLSLNEVLNDYQIKQYVLAKAKILLGNIRSTFGNSMPGGGDNIQLNGAELISQGKEELEAIKKDILGQQEPLLMLIG